MSGSLNQVQLIGNLGRDPEVRTTQSGKRVVTLSLATSKSWKDDAGQRHERTEWHRIVIWPEGLGLIAEKYLAKGSKVFVQGELTTNKWTDQQGIERYSAEIHLSPFQGVLTMLDSRKDDQRSEHAAAEPAMAGTEASGPSWSAPTKGDLDGDIPF